MMFHLPGEEAEAESTRGRPAATALGSARTVSCCSRPPLLSSLQCFSSGRGRAADMTLSCFTCFSSERTPCWKFSGLSDNFSESIFFKTLSSKLWKILFFPPLKSANFQRIQTELCPGNWLLCSLGTEAHLSLGTFRNTWRLQLLKSSYCLPCVTLTAMTSEADANPLTPVV